MFILLIFVVLVSVFSAFGNDFSVNQIDFFYQAGADIHYERGCSQSNSNYTQKLIGNSSDLETDMASLLYCSEGKVREGVMKRIPDICFYAGMMRPSSGRVIPFYVDCPSSGKMLKRRYITRDTRSCLDKNYVSHTAQSFHYMANCFDFTEEERNDLFALFNHESGFMSNASSTRNALNSAFCMGQITLGLFKDLNKFIQVRNQPHMSRLKEGKKGHWEPYSDIYKQAENKCPSIKRLVVPPEILTTSFKTTSASYKLSNSAPFGCTMTSNLPACLFYSMYHYKNLLHRYYDHNELTEKQEGIVKKAQEDMLKSGAGEELAYFLPIQHGEMLVVKGDIKINGRDRNESFIFETDEEIRRFFVRNDIEYDDRLTIYKINVFPEKDLKDHFLRSGHNGGGTVVSQLFPTFMNRLKHRISQGSVCNLNSLCKRYREKLLNGETLSVQDLQKEWMRYVRRYPSQFKNPNEVDSFSADVDNHMGFLRNEGVDKDPTPLASKFRKLHGEDTVSKELVDSFVQRVQLECADYIK